MTDVLAGIKRIERELALLESDADPPTGWEARVLSAIGAERIERELGQLDTDTDPPAGWEARVRLATGGTEHALMQLDPEADLPGDRQARAGSATSGEPIDRELPRRHVRADAGTAERPKRRWWQVAIPAFAVAAGAFIVFWPRSQSQPLALDLEIAQVGAVTLAPKTTTSTTLGNVAHATATGGDPQRAVWIYRDDRMLVVACPGDARCRETETALAVNVTLDAIGVYRFVALTSKSPIPPPRGRYDDDLAAALGAGSKHAIRSIAVR